MLAHVGIVSALGSARVPGLFTCAAARRLLRGLPRGHRRRFPADVPYVAMYSRSDGIVDWRSCLDPAAEHVEVAPRTRHGGSAEVYEEIAFALGTFAQAEGETGPKQPKSLRHAQTGARP